MIERLDPSSGRISLFETLVRKLGTDLQRAARGDDEQQRARWAADPVAFCVEELGVPSNTLIWSENPGYEKHRWDGTRDPIAALLRGVSTHRRIGVEAGVATQKTFTLALLVFAFLATYPNSTVVTYAPKKDQLKKHLWKEVSKLWHRFQRLRPQAELTDLRIRMIPESDVWSAYGFTVGVGAEEESAVRAQGGHDPDMLFIIEEGPGVHPAIVEALLNTAVDEHNVIVMVGNPNHQQDSLHEFCTKVPGVLHIRISALDHPNVVLKQRLVPGAVTVLSIEEKKQRYGGEDRPLYLSRVRGISPAESADALIRLAWCYEARQRGRELLRLLFPNDPDARLERLWRSDHPLLGPRGLGVDVANSEDGDRGATARGRGNVLCEVPSFPCPDANALGRRLVAETRSLGIEPGRVGIDGVGVGAGTVNEFRAEHLGVQNLMGGGRPVEFTDLFKDEKFFDLRSQMWWLMRLDLMAVLSGSLTLETLLKSPALILCDDEELFQDLITPTYGPRKDKIKVESKEELKKRLGRSPDKGDAAVYWNWCRRVRVTTGGGTLDLDV